MFISVELCYCFLFPFYRIFKNFLLHLILLNVIIGIQVVYFFSNILFSAYMCFSIEV